MAQNIGKVIQISGPAVDIQFSEANLPPIYEAIRNPRRFGAKARGQDFMGHRSGTRQRCYGFVDSVNRLSHVLSDD